MKRSILIIGLLFTYILTFAKSDNPPGTVKVSENLFCDKTEVANLAYKEYLSWMKRHFSATSDEYIAALPDTLVWRSPEAYNEPFVEYYFKHPAYGSYPLVGVSYEQAVAFCSWRSDRVNEKIYRDQHKIKSDEAVDFENIPNVYKYRLPTKVEWEKIASIGYNKKTIKKLSRKRYAECRTENFAQEIKVEIPKGNNTLNDKADITRAVRSYFPNALGIYNMLGNVAELTATKGVAKGGSWKHKAKDVTVEKDFSYEKPADWLGFRCVCEKVN